MRTDSSHSSEIAVTPHVEVWPIDRLVPYARNPRKNDHAVERMCASIREFGFKIPCLAKSDGEVVDGHLRLKAARQLNLAEVPVIPCDEWTPAQVKAFRLMVNRSVEWAEWDEELLALELQEIQDADLSLDLTGFDPREIDQLLTLPDEMRADPFLGSGTTLAAAELTGRVCCGLELDPKYVDVIVARWESLTGREATCDGQSFAELKQQRRPNRDTP